MLNEQVVGKTTYKIVDIDKEVISSRGVVPTTLLLLTISNLTKLNVMGHTPYNLKISLNTLYESLNLIVGKQSRNNLRTLFTISEMPGSWQSIITKFTGEGAKELKLRLIRLLDSGLISEVKLPNEVLLERARKASLIQRNFSIKQIQCGYIVSEEISKLVRELIQDTPDYSELSKKFKEEEKMIRITHHEHTRNKLEYERSIMQKRKSAGLSTKRCDICQNFGDGKDLDGYNICRECQFDCKGDEKEMRKRLKELKVE